VFGGIKISALPRFVQHLDALHASGDTKADLDMFPSHPIGQNGIETTHVILICSHVKRDKRCGVIGPMLADRFHEVLGEHGLRDTVRVLQVSHIGGTILSSNSLTTR
jgi:hypothetical protein